jgi:hypothetical protein
MADIYTYTREKLETKPGDFLSVFTYYVVAISKFVRFEFINAFFRFYHKFLLVVLYALTY